MIHGHENEEIKAVKSVLGKFNGSDPADPAIAPPPPEVPVFNQQQFGVGIWQKWILIRVLLGYCRGGVLLAAVCLCPQAVPSFLHVGSLTKAGQKGLFAWSMSQGAVSSGSVPAAKAQQLPLQPSAAGKLSLPSPCNGRIACSKGRQVVCSLWPVAMPEVEQGQPPITHKGFWHKVATVGQSAGVSSSEVFPGCP